MLKEFVNLDRSFAPIPTDREFTEDDYDLFLSFGPPAAKKWSDLLQLPRVIILAEAGAGKTEETRAAARRLRTDGRQAFFIRLEHLSESLEASFDVGSNAEFQGWLSSGKTGWFFLDSVDEARLSGPKQFELAIRSFGIILRDAQNRAYVYITSRPSEWRAEADLSLVREHLPFRVAARVSDEQSEDSPEVPSTSAVALTERSVDRDPKPIRPEVFSLLPLDQDQIGIFSRAYGVQDSDAFARALHRAEADIFCRRPGDLHDLISYWNQHGVIVNRASLIRDRVSSQLAEGDSDRATAFPLTGEKAQSGAEVLAVGVTFQRLRRILVPEQKVDPAVRDGSIDASKILMGWTVGEIRALLQRPIFDEAIYGAVRFHHGIVSEYLTAQWLNRLLLSGKSRRAIEHLFFTDRYGHEVAIPSMRPILAWIVLMDEHLREKTARIAPEVFLEGGDPSELLLDVRKNLLEQLCSRYADQHVRDSTFDAVELRRFAHPDLAETVNCLLELYSGHELLRDLLLEMVWQGEIRECSEKAVEFALNAANDDYTRSYAIRAVGTIGSYTQKKTVVDALVANPASGTERVIAEAVRRFTPNIVGTQEILTLITCIENSGKRPHSSLLRQVLEEFSQDRCPDADLLKWIQGLSSLLRQPPAIERGVLEISQRYSWLLPIAVLAVERLVRNRRASVLEESVLEVISLAQAQRTFDSYEPKRYALAELVPQWPELNRALFWHDVARARRRLDKKKDKRLTAWWYIGTSDRFWRFASEDFEQYLTDVRCRSAMDDRLVALSVAFHIYRENGRGRTRRSALKKAVNGVPELEDTLHRYLKPAAMSDQDRAWKRQEARNKRRQKQYETRETANRIKWREWLRSHTQVLRDTSVASTGSVWRATYYLLEELRRKREDGDKWVNGDWRDLIDEFGQGIAEAFRDGCMGYWRKYRPQVESDGLPSKNRTPSAVLVGLAGLAMEAQHISAWTRNLSGAEAETACRYAVNELNGFPDWLPDLHAAFPDVVETVIWREIEWEFSRYSGDIACHYILDDVAWGADWLKHVMSSKLLPLLEKHEPRHDDTVQKTLSIILAGTSRDADTLIEIAKMKLFTATSASRQALWLATWMSIDAKGALDALETLLGRSSGAQSATDLSMLFIVSLLGGMGERTPSSHQDYKRTEILVPLIKLMHVHIRTAEDIDRSGQGVYSPGLRDEAQHARNRLLPLLQEIPGKATYLAMMELAEHHPDERSRQWCRLQARRRAEADAELAPWQPGDITRFANEVERPPRNHRELFDLAVSRLSDLKLDLEEGDTSLAELLIDIKEETKHRNYIADWLRGHSHNRYNVPQEEELADAKRPDIRIHAAGFDGPVPIELKVADNWSACEMLERLNNQLCGQYLRDVRSNCGIFLLVYRGHKPYWKHPQMGSRLCLDELVHLLEKEAEKVVARDKKIEDLKVLGIDLSRRANRRYEHA